MSRETAPRPDRPAPRRWPTLGSALLAAAVLALAACGEELIQAPEPAGEEEAGPDPSAAAAPPRLTLDVPAGEAAPGDEVTLEVALERRPGGLTPTGYALTLRFDPGKLEPLSAAGRDGPGLHVVNPEAGPGRVRLAGAAPDGLGDGRLAEVRLRVTGTGWRESLHLEVGSMDVLERDFAEVAARMGRVRPSAGGRPSTGPPPGARP